MSKVLTHSFRQLQDFSSADMADAVVLLQKGEQDLTELLKDLAASSELMEAYQELTQEKLSSQSFVYQTQIKQLMVVKLGASLDHEAHKALRKLYLELKNHRVKSAQLIASAKFSRTELVQLIKRFELENTSFNRYKTSGISADLSTEPEKEYRLHMLEYFLADVPEQLEELELEAAALARSVYDARVLVNEPACVVTPSYLAQHAQELGERYGFEVEVHGPSWIVQEGLEAYWQVAKGSDEEPRFIIMRYNNAPHSSEKLGLIGKGMCYDSGGYAIKPASSMNTMQTDMAGSAAVINAMAALAQTKAPVNVVAIVAACENMISGHAYRNGDIIGSLAGKYIEVKNTDAEGRLTLADALTYAWQKEGATKLVDIATLTGAVIIALGYHYTGVLSDDEGLWENLTKASRSCGDKVWRFPIDEEYAQQNSSKFADIKNSGGRAGGSITAGHFVRAFAGEKPFMHLDIAATSWLDAADEYNPYGATGVGTELLYYLAREEFDA